MHQITDADMQAEMRRLLDGIQVKWVRARITLRNGRNPSRQTIYDWLAGDGVTFEHLQRVSAAVDRPLRLGDDEAAPAPQWVRGLQRALAAVLQDRGISPDDAWALSEAWAVLERARKQQSPTLDAVLLDPDV